MNYRFEITIDLDEIQQAIYTEGVWHPAENATAWGVNPSNEPILDRRVREGLDDLLARMSGYLQEQNINFNVPSGNIALVVVVEHRPLLMSLYGDEDSIYGTAWRMNRARVLLLLSRP